MMTMLLIEFIYMLRIQIKQYITILIKTHTKKLFLKTIKTQKLLLNIQIICMTSIKISKKTIKQKT